ncbi:MAG: flagellar biosynthetic protein FliR [Pseudomonadota bacterium]
MDESLFSLVELSDYVFAVIWPLMRIGGMLLVLPAVAGAYVPIQLRLVLAVALALLSLPVAAAPSGINVFSLSAVPLIAMEVGIGIAMGFALKLVLDAVALGGQSVALSMGLGFAIFIDSARGVNVPVVSQFLMLLTTLIFLALDGHISAIAMLVDSYRALPVGAGGDFVGIVGGLLRLSGIVFAGAVQIALPAVAALAIVNIAFGVMSRAAPTLNLFAVGFPVSLLFGVLALMLTLDGFTTVVGGLFDRSLAFVGAVAGGVVP